MQIFFIPSQTLNWAEPIDKYAYSSQNPLFFSRNGMAGFVCWVKVYDTNLIMYHLRILQGFKNIVEKNVFSAHLIFVSSITSSACGKKSKLYAQIVHSMGNCNIL